VQDYGDEDRGGRLPTLNRTAYFPLTRYIKYILLTIIDWHARGGLATRGVLIHYKSYAERKGLSYSPFTAHKITISAMGEIAHENGIRFQPGDVFILRPGFTEVIEEIADAAERTRLASSPDSAGVEDNMDAVRWFWNRHFSAVAADNPGFEVMRPTKDGADASGTTADYGELPL
jgi:hypothetical protein